VKNSVKVSIVGAVLFVSGPILGFAATVVGMVLSFVTIAESDKSVRPEQVANDMSYALLSTSIGIGVGLVGACIGLGGLIAYLVGRKRSSSTESQPAEHGPAGP
jgi:biopolymer transport protein ExbB/TolQ